MVSDVLSASEIYENCKSWPQMLDGRRLGWPQRLGIVKGA